MQLSSELYEHIRHRIQEQITGVILLGFKELKKLSVIDIFQETGISTCYVSKIVNGKRLASAFDLRRLNFSFPEFHDELIKEDKYRQEMNEILEIKNERLLYIAHSILCEVHHDSGLSLSLDEKFAAASCRYEILMGKVEYDDLAEKTNLAKSRIYKSTNGRRRFKDDYRVMAKAIGVKPTVFKIKNSERELLEQLFEKYNPISIIGVGRIILQEYTEVKRK